MHCNATGISEHYQKQGVATLTPIKQGNIGVAKGLEPGMSGNSTELPSSRARKHTGADFLLVGNRPQVALPERLANGDYAATPDIRNVANHRRQKAERPIGSDAFWRPSAFPLLGIFHFLVFKLC